MKNAKDAEGVVTFRVLRISIPRDLSLPVISLTPFVN